MALASTWLRSRLVGALACAVAAVAAPSAAATELGAGRRPQAGGPPAHARPRDRVIAALETLHNLDLGGITVSVGPQQRVGSRFVEVTVIGSDGNLLK